MPRRVIRAAAAPPRSAGNGRTRRRMRGKAVKRNQPAADPRPFVFRPWFHFLCEATLSASTGWSEITIPTLKAAVKSQLKLVDEQQIDMRLRQVSMWNLNCATTSSSQIPIGLASSYAVDEKDANMMFTGAVNASVTPGRAPPSFQNVVEDRPGKNAFARVKISWPGSQQKKVWADSYQANGTAESGAFNSQQYDMPAFYYYGNSVDVPSVNLVVRFSGWWRPVEAVDSNRPVPAKINIVGRDAQITPEVKVFREKVDGPTAPASVMTNGQKVTYAATVKKFKAAKSPPPSIAPSDSVSNASKDKRTPRSQAFRKWKDTFSTSGASSCTVTDGVSQSEFAAFKTELMQILNEIRGTANRATQAVDNTVKHAKDVAKAVIQQSIPANGPRDRRRMRAAPVAEQPLACQSRWRAECESGSLQATGVCGQTGYVEEMFPGAIRKYGDDLSFRTYWRDRLNWCPKHASTSA